jgi:hypothetical protein
MDNKIVIFGILLFLVPQIFLIQGCTTKTTRDNLLGHWHRLPPDNSSYNTIDIQDTITVTDKYDLLSGGYLEYKRIDITGNLILPTNYFEHSTKFTLINDTLIIQDSLESYKYVKSDLRECLILDRYTSCAINIQLDSSKTSDYYEASYKQFCSWDLFIGKLKSNSDFRDSLSRAFPDSIFIQTNDVLIDLDDIPKLCEQVRGVCSDNKNPLNINLHVDINVSDNFIKQIESSIPQTFSIHKIVNVDNKDIGLKRIR